MDYTERLAIHNRQVLMRPIRSWLKATETFLAHRVASLTIADSPPAAAAMHGRGVNSCISVLNTPPRDFGLPTPGKSTNSRGPVVGRIGAFSKQLGQGAEDLIELLAAARDSDDLHNLRILLVGNFVPASYKKEIQVKIHQWREYVTIVDYVPHNEVPSWYARMDLTIIRYDVTDRASYSKYSSIQKLFEAMACGIPVVISASEYPERIVRDTGCGVVASSPDTQAIMQAMRELLADDSLRIASRERGRRAFETSFRWEIEENRLLDSYPILPDGTKNCTRTRQTTVPI
jgi:glycosyltransferase involved in cell wall biosynthesis